jgi:hypothetical protein
MANPGGRAPAGPRVATFLTTLRMIFFAYLLGLFTFGFVLLVITGNAEEKKAVAGELLIGLIAVGLVGIAGALWSRRRPLDTASAATLATSYRTNMLVGIAFSEAPVVLTVAATLITDRLWLYPFGLVPALIGFWVVGPSARDIRRQQERVSSQGSALSLMDVLTQPPARPERDP